MANHCNSYGFSGGFGAICAAIAWYLVQDRECKLNISNNVGTGSLTNTCYNQLTHVGSDQLQMFHYIAIIVGIVLFVLSFFDFAGILYEVTLLFCAAAVAIFASGGMMLYATYISFNISCKGIFEKTINTYITPKNVFDAQDEVGISIMVLDLLCGLMLISAAISFARTW